MARIRCSRSAWIFPLPRQANHPFSDRFAEQKNASSREHEEAFTIRHGWASFRPSTAFLQGNRKNVGARHKGGHVEVSGTLGSRLRGWRHRRFGGIRELLRRQGIGAVQAWAGSHFRDV